MNMPTVFWLVAAISILFFTIFTFLFVYRIFQGLQTFRRSGGVKGVVSSIQAAAAAMPPSRSYPIVSPTIGTGVALWIGVILVVLGLLLIVGGGLAQMNHIRQVRLLDSEGVVMRALITDKSISEGEDSDTYYVHYVFSAVVQDQRIQVEKKDSVPESFYDEVEYGSDLEVIYVESDPHIVRIRALYTPGKVEYWWIIVLGGLGLMCWLVAWGMSKNHANARQLDDQGMPIVTRLLDLYKEESSDSTSYYVAYELPGVGPIRHAVDERVFVRLKVGDTIRLVYLPDRPKVFRPQWD